MFHELTSETYCKKTMITSIRGISNLKKFKTATSSLRTAYKQFCKISSMIKRMNYQETTSAHFFQEKLYVNKRPNLPILSPQTRKNEYQILVVLIAKDVMCHYLYTSQIDIYLNSNHQLKDIMHGTVMKLNLALRQDLNHIKLFLASATTKLHPFLYCAISRQKCIYSIVI